MTSFANFLGRVFVLGLILPTAAWAQANLSVNSNQVVRTVDERVFGLNAVMWDNQTGTAQTISLLQDAGVRTIRVPGGSLSDEYHWTAHTVHSSGQNWPIGFNVFTQLITGLNSQAFVSVNYGSGTPEEAAAWVAYANASTGSTVPIGPDSKGYNWQTAGTWASLRTAGALGGDDGMNFLRISRSAPIGIKYWEIGNECYGPWEYDLQAVPHDPTTYANRAGVYITKMKAVDPTIKVGVVVVTGTQYNNWNAVMLSRLKALNIMPDFVIYHRYEQTPLHDTDLAHSESDSGLLQKAMTWQSDAADIRQQVNNYLGAGGPSVELVVTENNSVYTLPGKQTTSLVNGLYLADSIGNILQTEFNALAWWDLRNSQDHLNNNNSALYGWRQYGDYGILSSPSVGGSATAYEPYPTYYVTKLLSRFARGGDTVVSASSNHALLTVFAVKRANGSLSLLVINKDPVNSLTATIALTGFSPDPSATTYTYGKPQDTAAQTGTGETDIVTGSISVGGATFSASFASYSVTVLSLNAGPVSIAPAITSQPVNQTIVAGETALFGIVASGTPAPAFQWQRLPAGSGVWGNVIEGGSYAGSASATLSVGLVSAVMTGDQFRCVATNAVGSAASDGAFLSVVVAPSGAVITITVE